MEMFIVDDVECETDVLAAATVRRIGPRLVASRALMESSDGWLQKMTVHHYVWIDLTYFPKFNLLTCFSQELVFSFCRERHFLIRREEEIATVKEEMQEQTSASVAFYRTGLRKLRTVHLKTVAGLKEQHSQELDEQKELVRTLKAELEMQTEQATFFKVELERQMQVKTYEEEVEWLVKDVEYLKEEAANLQTEYGRLLAALKADHQEEIQQYQARLAQTASALEMAVRLQQSLELHQSQERPERKAALQRKKGNTNTYNVVKDEGRKRLLKNKKALLSQEESVMVSSSTQQRPPRTTGVRADLDLRFVTPRRSRPSRNAAQDAEGRTSGQPVRRWK